MIKMLLLGWGDMTLSYNELGEAKLFTKLWTKTYGKKEGGKVLFRGVRAGKCNYYS